MNSKILYCVLLGVLAILAAVGLAAFYYAAFGNLTGLIPESIRNILKIESPTSQTPTVIPTGPQMALLVDANGRLLLTWKNLPKGIRDIHIFRAREVQPN